MGEVELHHGQHLPPYTTLWRPWAALLAAACCTHSVRRNATAGPLFPLMSDSTTESITLHKYWLFFFLITIYLGLTLFLTIFYTILHISILCKICIVHPYFTYFSITLCFYTLQSSCTTALYWNTFRLTNNIVVKFVYYVHILYLFYSVYFFYVFIFLSIPFWLVCCCNKGNSTVWDQSTFIFILSYLSMPQCMCGLYDSKWQV